MYTILGRNCNSFIMPLLFYKRKLNSLATTDALAASACDSYSKESNSFNSGNKDKAQALSLRGNLGILSKRFICYQVTSMFQRDEAVQMQQREKREKMKSATGIK